MSDVLLCVVRGIINVNKFEVPPKKKKNTISRITQTMTKIT